MRLFTHKNRANMQMNDDISNNSDKRAKLPVKVWRVVLGLFVATRVGS